MDKVREEFELAWQIKGMDDEGNLGNKPTRSKIDSDIYAGDAAQFAWMWWKRSRESVIVKIPKEGEASSFGNYIVFDYESVVKMLEEAGVRYE